MVPHQDGRCEDGPSQGQNKSVRSQGRQDKMTLTMVFSSLAPEIACEVLFLKASQRLLGMGILGDPHSR